MVPVLSTFCILATGMKRRDDIEGYYKYELQASSKLCGADIESPYTCNDKPHRFVITVIAAITRDHAMQAHATISQSMVKVCQQHGFH